MFNLYSVRLNQCFRQKVRLHERDVLEGRKTEVDGPEVVDRVDEVNKFFTSGSKVLEGKKSWE